MKVWLLSSLGRFTLGESGLYQFIGLGEPHIRFGPCGKQTFWEIETAGSLRQYSLSLRTVGTCLLVAGW